MRIFTFLSLTILLLACNRQSLAPELADKDLYQGQKMDQKEVLTTIALGSCNREDLPQKMWQHILANDPQLWIWLGDNIYGDTENMEVMKAKYLKQKFGAEYSKLRATTTVVGTWDDHDFGANDAGKEYRKRVESQALMLDFLDVPQDAPVRKQEGGYQSYTFGKMGKKVKVILLDSRYFRDKPIRKPNRSPGYLPNNEGTILGEEQCAWFENELKDSDAQIHLIGNGIQLIPEDHNYEKWKNFPLERQRVFDLLAQYKVANPILLSGDRHIAEISKLDVKSYGPIYELTSSGMTHSYEGVGDEPNQHRISDIIGKLNFGLIKINWESPQPKIELEVRGLNNVIYTAASVN